ncbi:conserved hypothetical protein [Echinococcus multilocularis]|uniref:Uncharacterized protein n=1 Tax=Echinococcus multilocularis TaxID=6211 RepID=A0A068Y3P9_ECHMU|nr:conserved hypothetical protein [Echinococcus multilocularis]
MVLSSLTGSVQTKIITSEEKLKTVSELTWVNQGENEDDLDSKVNASRILSSRLNHRCERCTPRRRVGSELSSTTCSSIRDQMQKELTSLSLDSVSDNESDPETPISGKWEKEDVVDKKLRELLTMQRCGKEDTQLSASEIPLCGILQTLSPTANVQRPLPTSSMITTAASSFNRIPSLRRLHPLKLRPMVKTSGKLGHSKEVRHGVGNGRKSPVTALPGRRISDFESGRTSANGHPHTPRKTSIPRHPPPPRADLAKKASLSMARKVA